MGTRKRALDKPHGVLDTAPELRVLEFRGKVASGEWSQGEEAADTEVRPKETTLSQCPSVSEKRAGLEERDNPDNSAWARAKRGIQADAGPAVRQPQPKKPCWQRQKTWQEVAYSDLSEVRVQCQQDSTKDSVMVA